MFIFKLLIKKRGSASPNPLDITQMVLLFMQSTITAVLDSSVKIHYTVGIKCPDGFTTFEFYDVIPCL
jgi:hypothetical protein